MEKNTTTKNNFKKIFVSEEMSSSYLSYAMSVIVSRALPDVRDGLKPVHRRIIYAMYKGGYDWSKPFRKSARIVGDVIGKYHPHGDQAVYDALVRMVQEFSMSQPLISGQGNFGSIDGDPPAAMRYTETKLGKISQYLTEDLEKNTVNFRGNYDETEKEPEVLPSQYPNLLVNGAGGIAVGMATSIPPHNLGEIISATIAYIKNNNITISQLMKYVPGPDFPTGGIIIGKEIIKQGYNKGRGSFKIRGDIEFEEKKNGRSNLVIKSIPFQVNKSSIIEKVAQLAKDKKIDGISDIRDESNREGVRVVLELKKGIEPETIRRQLYKLSNIETSFGFNTLALVNNIPKVLNLKSFISEFVSFRELTVINRLKFDLKKAQERAHILLGLAVAVDNIDEVIKVIKKSKDAKSAKQNILSKKWAIKKSKKIVLAFNKKDVRNYNFTEKQVESILELKLQKLTSFGIAEIDNELNELIKKINFINKLLKSKKDLSNLIINELEFIKDKFAKPRRTKIIDAVLNYNIEETIQKQSVVINITKQGYIKRSPLTSVKTQKRGGKGKTGITTRDEDFVIQIFTANTHTPLLFFSTQGLVYKLKAYKIPEGTAASKGKSIFNILPLKSHHTISSIMPLPENENEWKNLMVLFVTANGNIRKNSLEDFINISASGKIAMKLAQDDKIIGVKICSDDQHVLIGTKNGKCIRFEAKKIRLFKGRSSKGIKAMNLQENDKIISLSILLPDQKNGSKGDKNNINILSVTEKGYGKRTKANDFRLTNRGGKGIIGIINSERNGNVASHLTVLDDDEIILSTDKGSIMRCAVKDIRLAGRNTQGVRIKKLSGDEKVVSVIKIEDSAN